MFTQLNLYAIVALFVAVLALGGGWWYQSSRDAATIDVLKANKVRLEDAVTTNEKTIAQMTADAQALAASNQKLSHSIMATEMEQASSWNAIDAMALESDGDATGIEAKANDTFAASIDAIRAATAR